MTSPFQLLGRMHRLPSHDKKMAMETAALLVFFRLALFALPYRSWRRYLGDPWGVGSHPVGNRMMIAGVSQWIQRVSPYLSIGRGCLCKALAARAMLKRRGIETTLFLGVQKDTAGNLCAHAWLMAGNIPVTGGKDNGDLCQVAQFR